MSCRCEWLIHLLLMCHTVMDLSFGGAMIVLWFACVAQPKSVPVDNELCPRPRRTFEPSKTQHPNCPMTSAIMSGFNAQAEQQCPDALDQGTHPSLEQGDSPMFMVGLVSVCYANENLTAACEGPDPSSSTAMAMHRSTGSCIRFMSIWLRRICGCGP